MICLDLDGTLLNDDKMISRENKLAVRRAYDRGLAIVLATGRQYRKAKEFARMLDVPVTIIGNNGTCIRNAVNDQRLHFNPMPRQLLQTVLEYSETFGLTPIVHVDRYEEGTDIVISSELPFEVSRRYGLLQSDWVEVVDVWEDRVLRNAVSMVYFGTRKEIIDWYQTLKRDVIHPHVIHVMENLQNFESMLEILGDTGTKWHGIQLHARAEGIRPEEIMAIGDDSNDLQMLHYAGYSYAPSNATEIVRRKAGIVLDRSNNEHAVAAAIYEVLR